VIPLPDEFLLSDSDMYDEFSNTTHWPKHILLHYAWRSQPDVSLQPGLYVMLSVGLLVALLVSLNNLAGLQGKLQAFLRDVVGDTDALDPLLPPGILGAAAAQPIRAGSVGVVGGVGGGMGGERPPPGYGGGGYGPPSGAYGPPSGGSGAALTGSGYAAAASGGVVGGMASGLTGRAVPGGGLGGSVGYGGGAGSGMAGAGYYPPPPSSGAYAQPPSYKVGGSHVD